MSRLEKTCVVQGERYGSAIPHYAVIFRTHFWDAFARRQFDRIVSQVRSGDVYVVVDETRGSVSGIPTERVFRLTDGQIVEAGYVAAGEGSVQWFSGDVPLYMFFAAHGEYEYYLQLEYDVSIHTDVDELIARLAADNVDLVAFTESNTKADWTWLSTCIDAYEPHEIRHQLICLSAFSNRALQLLSGARQEQARRFRAGELRAWPFCEAFVATEARRLGLRSQELSAYGDVGRYDSWPPSLEDKLPTLQRRTFIHPVLDRERYVWSLVRWQPGFKELALPLSWLHRKLWELGPFGYFAALRSKPFKDALSKCLERLRD